MELKMERNNLTREEKIFIQVPESIILNDNKYLCMAYLFVRVKTSLDLTCCFRLGDLITYFGYIPNTRGTMSINERFEEALQILDMMGYISNYNITRENNHKTTKLCKFDVNIDKFSNFVIYDEETESYVTERYGYIYLDEFNMIRKDGEQSKKYCYYMIILYLRLHIGVWNGHLSSRWIEAYPQFKASVYNALRMTRGMFNDCMDLLSNKYGILGYEELSRYQDDNLNWRTRQSIFYNKYKRMKIDGEYFEISGEEYYKGEVDECVKGLKKGRISSDSRNRFYENEEE